ncbi:uncharacterized protein LOC131024692 isoform X2 [Salvia miltiorrhiza]|uniref:uncharacterized protein LOC131024692 isoform X2 n=1 Tax=Salvia miltiorrhiza TaxID=226208 RepID=UPI0025AC8774|nr:uncharacterized protein LOC131024692 isoform X2 [Salvia miltiorrhiza]XP_057810202.1 uncharacterized protein LOC131024692 isoform X2 [Salvia miltiorrhiza]XP_057810203.1 uncharacterized protein LOC131024692 isoform X2 [Salvia miltiorrhiza]
MEPMIDPSSSIPELIKFIKHSFRECEFDEVQNTLMEREKSMKVEMEKLVRECDELKKQVDFLERSKGYSELEKCDLEEKLRESQKKGEELDKMIVQTNEKFEKLRSEKHDVENELVRSIGKCEEMDERLAKMGKEIEELRRESLYANKTIEELKAKEIEADRVVQELKRQNNEAAAAIDTELEKNMQNGEVNPEEDRATESPEFPAISGSHASVMQSGGEAPAEKAVASSFAAGKVVIVICDSDSDGETHIPDTLSGQTKRRKISTSAAPSRCRSLPSSRVEERAGALQKSRTVDRIDSTDSDDSISAGYTNNLTAMIESRGNNNKGAGGSGSGRVEGGSTIPVVDIDDDVPIPATVQDIPTPAFLQKKRKAAVVALAEKRRMAGQQKASKFVDPEAEPASEAEAVSVDAAGGKALALPARESEASGSKPILSLKGRDFVRTLHSHIHPQDREAMKKMKRATLTNSLGQLCLQLESRVGEAIQCINGYDALENDLKKERELTAKRDEEVAGMVERYSKAEADVTALQAHLAQVEVEKASLASELERAKKEGYDNLVRFRMRYETEHRESRRNWKKACEGAQHRGYVMGARDQRLEFFLSPQGQQFLGIMLEGTLAAFQKTPDYLEGFAQIFAHVIKQTAMKTAEMLGASAEQAAALDMEALMDNIKDEDLNRLLGITAESPKKPGWWYPVLEKALPQFAFGVYPEPVPTAPVYWPPFCTSLAKFVDQLRGQPGASLMN